MKLLLANQLYPAMVEKEKVQVFMHNGFFCSTLFFNVTDFSNIIAVKLSLITHFLLQAK